MKEKNSVTVTCSALTPCPQSPPELTWNLQPNPHRQMERNTNGTFTTTIQQDISLSEIHDGYNIFCSARYPVDGGEHKTANTEVTLSVFYAPKETLASRWVELFCSSRVNPSISCSTWVENSTYKARIVTKGDVKLTVYGGEVDCYEDSSMFSKDKNKKLLIPLITVTIVAVLVFLVLWLCEMLEKTQMQSQRRFLKSRRTAVQHNQTEASEEPGVLASLDGVLQPPSNEMREELHYEDVNFRKKPTCASESTSRDQQETLYAQVKVSEPKKGPTQTADSSDPLYSTQASPPMNRTEPELKDWQVGN
ncbi:uncharacterized protein LOC122824090 [Gambusia affinis]|uniref:uncharacterized protein LOC122824090 n=1 Tax=Gambusia affinis TaxID=33528 RepID=UPI001CDD79A7|nr:uncharacterized protein LOC122824090 [Gambusia affinis]